MSEGTKVKEQSVNGKQSIDQSDELETLLHQWLIENKAIMLIYMISPSGVPVPLIDCLGDLFQKWQVGFKPIAKNG